MDATVKSIFDEMINRVRQNMMDEKFDESCDKISDLARTLWFDHKALTFEEMSDIKNEVFKLRSDRMHEEFKMECKRMDEEFERESNRMREEFENSSTTLDEPTGSPSNNGWLIMEQNRIINDMNQQMINNTIIQNHIINSMMM